MIILRTWPFLSKVPMPNSSRPALFETRVRFLAPESRRAATRFSAMPQTPKPPSRIVAPSLTREAASAAVAMVLFIVGVRSVKTDVVDQQQAAAGLVARIDDE